MNATLLTLALLAGLPDAGPYPGVVGISAPLGRMGDVVEAPKAGGYPANELVVVSTLEGCDRPQALQLSRLVAATATAALQVESWLDGKGQGAPKGLQTRLFGKAKRLTEVAKRAKAAQPSSTRGFPPQVTEGWKLTGGWAAKAPTEVNGLHLFVDSSKEASLSAAILVSPAPAERADRCRPRISTLLFDAKGVARFAYHADFGGNLEVELTGDRCRGARLVFDPPSDSFVPVPHQPCAGPSR